MICCTSPAHGSSSSTSSAFLAAPTSLSLLVPDSPPASCFDLFDPFDSASPHLFPPLDSAASTASPDHSTCLSASDSSVFMAASSGDPSLFALSSPHPEAFQMCYPQEMFHWGPGEEVRPSGLSRKRFTMSDLEELMAEDEANEYLLAEFEGSVSSKRLRGASGWVTVGDCTAAALSGDSSNSSLEAETLLDSSWNEGGKFQAVDKISNAEDQKIANGSFEASKSCLEDASILHCGDLDDILDMLLHKEAAPSEPSRTVLQSFGPSRVSTNGSKSSCRNHGILENGASTQFSNSVQHPDNRDLSLASTTASLQKEREVLIEREQSQIAHDRTPRRSWDWQAAIREKPSTASIRSQPLGSCSDLSHSSREERSFKSNASVLTQQSQPKLSGCKRESVQVWAGPTLLEIESVLAMKDSSPLMYSAAPTNVITSSSLSSPLSECLDGEAPRQKGASGVWEDADRSGEFPSEEQRYTSWRRLLKRGIGEEPKYTLKLRCEEEAVNDGYRWRKYGQKTIKSSPYPRSYYRCTSCKCTAKKQVERSIEDPRLLLVTYEGIHLHPQPNPLANCLPSHLVEHEDTPLHRTCSSLSSSSSSSYVPTHLSSPNPTSDFSTLLHHCTSPPPSLAR